MGISMKKMFIIAVCILLSSCASMGSIMQGVGNGLQSNSNYQPTQIQQPISCTSSIIGNQAYTNCN